MNLLELRTALKERRDDYSPSDARLNRLINQAYLDICSRRKWGWLRREYTASTKQPVTITGTVANNIVATNGQKVITLAAALLPAPTASMLGKRIIISGSFYEIVDLNISGLQLTLDRIYTGTTYPDVTVAPVDYGSLQVIYEDIALPLGTQSIVEAVLFTGPSASALSISGVLPATMISRNKNSTGMPTSCSAIEKKPIYRPRRKISDFGVLAPATAAGLLTPGAAYTYWYTHYDKATGAESALSGGSTITLSAANNQVQLPAITTRTDYVHRIYRSTAGGKIPYLLSDPLTATSNILDTTADEYLGVRGPESASSLFLSLYPAPGSIYAINVIYQTEATKLDADDDRPLFDAGFSGVLLDGSEYLMLTSADEQRRATNARSTFEMGIQRMIQQDRLNFKQRVLVGRNARRVVGRSNTWDGAFPDYGNSGL